MAKKITVSVILITVALFAVACNIENTVDNHVEVTKAEEIGAETVDANVTKTTISGSFTVCVRDVIPDYCMDNVTKNVAVVTEFQSNPFTVFVGEEIANQLEIGQNYVFTINPIEVDEAKEDIEGMSLASLVWELPEFEITEFRLANEDELGLESLTLTITME